MVHSPTAQAVFHPIDLPAVGSRSAADPTDDHRATLTFTDASVIRWARDAHGKLVELEPRLLMRGVERVEHVLDKFTEDFSALYGVSVGCQTDDWSTRLAMYLSSSRSGDIADVLDAPHDWLGDLVANEVIDPVAMCDDQRATFAAGALAALTFQDRIYGVPFITQ